MAIETVDDIAEVYQPSASSYKVVGGDGSTIFVPAAEGNRHYALVVEWLVSNDLNEEAYAADLAAAQEKRISEVKAEAWNLLHPTDWYDIREAAGGDPTPVNITAYRQAIRDTTDIVETDVNALTTINEVRDYTFDWPIAP